MQSNYAYYPRVLAQPNANGFQNNSNQNNNAYLYSNQNFLQNSQFINEDKLTACDKFLKLFSFLPCLPSSLSQTTRGAIGLSIFLLFVITAAVLGGLTPVFINLASTDEIKESFSIDVQNGLRIQNSDLFDLLTSIETPTLEQNLTVLNEINTLTNQLNSKTKPLLDANLDKIYNIRLVPNQARSIDVSYSIKTKPLTKPEVEQLKQKINNLVKESKPFENILLNNSTINLNDKLENIVVSSPVTGEIGTKSTILLSSKNNDKSSLETSGNVLKHGSIPVEEFAPLLKAEKKSPKLSEEEKKIIEHSSKIKLLKDYNYYPVPYPQYSSEYYHDYQLKRPYNSEYPSEYPTSYNSEYPTDYKKAPSDYKEYKTEKYSTEYPNEYKTTEYVSKYSQDKSDYNADKYETNAKKEEIYKTTTIKATKITEKKKTTMSKNKKLKKSDKEKEEDKKQEAEIKKLKEEIEEDSDDDDDDDDDSNTEEIREENKINQTKLKNKKIESNTTNIVEMSTTTSNSTITKIPDTTVKDTTEISTTKEISSTSKSN